MVEQWSRNRDILGSKSSRSTRAPLGADRHYQVSLRGLLKFFSPVVAHLQAYSFDISQVNEIK